jgi:PHD/YefM family antitoxin component YafN of YafNO toxin-antitoxin module
LTIRTLLCTYISMGLPKVKSATELREDLFSTIQNVLKGQIQIITHKNGDSVLLSKDKYDELLDKIETLQGISRGLKDLAEQRFSSHGDVKKELTEYMKKR